MSHWQKVKLHHKTGERKEELENHFGIKTAKPVIQTGEKKSHVKKSKKKQLR